MIRRIVLSLIFTMALCVTLSTAISWAKYETIPPEILQQYDPEILSGERPKFAIVTNADIWDLRDHPDRGGDLVLLKLDAGKLSSPQIEIIRNWVKQGARVYLNSQKSVRDLIHLLFNMECKSPGYVRKTTLFCSPNVGNPLYF